MCCHKVISYDPQRWVPCRTPNRPSCLGNPVVDKVDVREHSCKHCVKQILPTRSTGRFAYLDWGREVTELHHQIGAPNVGEQVTLPPEFLASIPRPFPDPAVEESRPPSRSSYTEAEESGFANPDAPARNVAVRYTAAMREALRVATPSPFHSPAPSSSQKTGVVYTEDKKKYPYTVQDVNTHLPIELSADEQLWESEELDQAARDEMGTAFESYQRVIRW